MLTILLFLKGEPGFMTERMVSRYFCTTYDHEFSDLVNPGDTVNIDCGMEVTAGGMEGNYRLTVQLVSYGIQFPADASIEDVLKPIIGNIITDLTPCVTNLK